MTNAIIYRGCDVQSPDVARAVKRQKDLSTRAVALLDEESGVPPDPAAPDDPGASLPPTLDVVSSSWCQVQDTGEGLLPPGTYRYSLVPYDFASGRTGAPVSVADLVISTLGEEATLCVVLGANNSSGALVQRDDVLVGSPVVVGKRLLNNIPVVTQAEVTGAFDGGTSKTFHRTSGADIIAGDAVVLERAGQDDVVVVAQSVAADVVTFSPPLTVKPQENSPAFFEVTTRVGPYVESPITTPVSFPLGVPVPPTVPLLPLSFVVPPFFEVDEFAVPQFGDLIMFGAKTAIVYGTGSTAGSPNPLVALPSNVRDPAAFYTVGIMPFGVQIPPVVFGQYQIVKKNDGGLQVGAPGFGFYHDGDGASFLIDTDDEKLIEGASVLYGTDIRLVFSKDPVGSSFRVVFSGDPTVLPPTEGMYFVLPLGLSPLLAAEEVVPTGTYRRLSRQTTTQVATSLWQLKETGRFQTRTGDLPDSASESLDTLDQIMAQNGYPGGALGFLADLRGDTSTRPQAFYARSGGNLTLLGDRVHAVNAAADAGGGLVVDVERLRRLLASTCGTTQDLADIVDRMLVTGVVVQKYRSTSTTTPGAGCPPGAPAVVTTALECDGFALTSNKLPAGVVCRVFWAPGCRSRANAQAVLVARGLTPDEAAAAVNLEATGRVLEAIEFSREDVSDVQLSGNVEDQDDLSIIVGDDRVRSLDVGTLNTAIVDFILRNRGNAGLVPVPVGNVPGNQEVDQFLLLANLVLQAVSENPASLGDCDFGGALESLNDNPVAQAAVAGLFAMIDATLEAVTAAGTRAASFFREPKMEAILNTISVIESAKGADPSLGCLFGPINVQAPSLGLPSIPELNALLADGSVFLRQRFDLTQSVNLILETVLCAVTRQMINITNANSLTGVSQTAAAGETGVTAAEEAATVSLSDTLFCFLPPSTVEFPSIEVEVSIRCATDKLSALVALVNASTAEVNEVIALLNSYVAGVAVAEAQGDNNRCSGDESTFDVFQRINQILSGSAVT